MVRPLHVTESNKGDSVKVINHKQVTRKTPFGNGELNTTLCGRMSLQTDGMNVDDKITCKLCLKKLKGTNKGG